MPITTKPDHVFVNCPFDRQYVPLFHAIVFAVHDCGLVARCALEAEDSGEVRIAKLYDIIEECGLGIHDVSRTELDAKTRLPRFNMPLELGIFLGAKRYGQGGQRDKRALILDRERYRYQKFCSDISGQDISEHKNRPPLAIAAVRAWVATIRSMPRRSIPGGTVLAARYKQFKTKLPRACKEAQIETEELTFPDYANFVVEWLTLNPW